MDEPTQTYSTLPPYRTTPPSPHPIPPHPTPPHPTPSPRHSSSTKQDSREPPPSPRTPWCETCTRRRGSAASQRSVAAPAGAASRSQRSQPSALLADWHLSSALLSSCAVSCVQSGAVAPRSESEARVGRRLRPRGVYGIVWTDRCDSGSRRLHSHENDESVCELESWLLSLHTSDGAGEDTCV